MNWDWIAGFMEGEGHIYWQWSKKGTKQGTGGRVIIGQKDKRALEAIHDFLLKEGFENPIFYLRPASKLVERSCDLWMLTLNRRPDVIRFLEKVLDGLFAKREKATFVIETLKRLNRERKEILETALALRKQGKSWREISRETKVGRVALLNYARAEGIELPGKKHPFDERSWRHDRQARGICTTCGKPRGADGTKWYCRLCADKINIKSKEWKRRKRAELKARGTHAKHNPP